MENEKKTCLGCRYFHIEQQQWETRPSMVECKQENRIIATGSELTDGPPKIPNWCPLEKEK